ncbi:MAG: XdhC family protein [Bacteroidota bacterium]
MLDIFAGIAQWMANGETFATATVIKTWGSSPRPIGSVLAVNSKMEMLGSVSGGCIEGAVVRESIAVLESAKPKRITYGVSDEEAWEVGLSCGGSVEVFIEPFLPDGEMWQNLLSAVNSNEARVLISDMSGESVNQMLWGPDMDALGDDTSGERSALAEKAYRERKAQTVEVEGKAYFLQVFPRKSQMIIVGAAHITVDLVSLAKGFGFETIVIDPRGIFAEKTQFPVPPDHLHVDWPVEVLPKYTLDPYTYVVLLTHDPKIDDQALHEILRADVAYIGALGSKRTAAKRKARLEAAGYNEAEIGRIYGPVGVSINAKRPREIALSIIAQIIEVQNAYL